MIESAATARAERAFGRQEAIKLFHAGKFIGPFVYGADYKLNLKNLKREHTPPPQIVFSLQVPAA